MTRRELARTATKLTGRALAYATCVSLASGFLAYGLRLDKIDLTIPMLDTGDTLLILPMVQARHEGGSHFVNERLGAPGRQELYDFPVIDSLHFAAVALIDSVVDHPVVAFNAYFLLTYPLAAFCAMLAGRCLGLSLPAAGCLGLLYAFLPYHQYRGLSHYFLSAYYLVPLALVVAVNLALGRVRARRVGWPVVVMLATSCAGAYYAFFACVMLAVAAPYGALLRGSVRPLGWGGLLIGVVFLGGLANHAPTFAYQREFGANTRPAARQPEDTEAYGLKLTYLIMPIPNHRVPALARWRSGHDSPSRLLQGESNTAMVGVVGVAGLVVGAVTLFHPRLRRRRVARAVAALMTAAILVATIGGVGAIFSDVVNPSVRAQARMSVVVAFFALWLALAALDRGLSRRWYVRWPLFTGVAALGLLDYTPRDWGRWDQAVYRGWVRERHDQDRLFYGGVEATLGGGTVFELPFNEYPEGVAEGGSATGSYDHARGFLHTKRTRWSFGAMKGREVDQWQRDVAAAEVPEMLRRVVLRGFDGLVLDWQFYAPAAAQALNKALLAELRCAGPSSTHGYGGRTFYDLRAHRTRLESESGGRYAELARAEAEAVRVLWFNGFAGPEPSGRGTTQRWCARRGEAWIANPSDRTRRVILTMTLRTESKLPTALRIKGGVWQESLTIDAESPAHSVTVEVPPGRHRVDFECDPPTGWLPRDARRHVFHLAYFQLAEER